MTYPVYELRVYGNDIHSQRLGLRMQWHGTPTWADVEAVVVEATLAMNDVGVATSDINWEWTNA